jgi:hypothetical protein
VGEMLDHLSDRLDALQDREADNQWDVWAISLDYTCIDKKAAKVVYLKGG